MISDDQLIAHLSGAMTGVQRAAFEDQLAAEDDALRQLLDQERIEAALQTLDGSPARRERVRQSILQVVAGQSAGQVKADVLRETGITTALKRAEGARGARRNARLAFWDAVLGHGRIVFWPAFSIPALLILVWLLPDSTPRPNTAQTTHSVATQSIARAAVTNALPTTRDPARWPFAADSVWNTPIGSGAQFAAVQPGGMDLASGVMVVDAGISHPIFYATTNDPVGNLHVPWQSAPFATVPVPPRLNARPFGGGNAILILPDGVTLLEINGARRDGADLRANNIARADLRGTGIPPEYRAATGSGLSQFGGSIRLGELMTRIPHVVGAVVPQEAVTLKPDGTAHVWPAGWSQANSPAARARMARTGNVHAGSLLAIPPEVDIAKLAAPGTPAHALVRAMQDYGVLVKDTFDGTYFTEWQREGSPHLVFCVEDLFNGDAPRDLARQLGPAIRELRVVTNHSPGSVGGGGARRRAAAPAFASP